MTKLPGIDHLVLAWHDLEVARGQFARFGFTLTPEAQHPFGTGNSLAQLQGCFLELLTVVAPEKLVPMTESRFSFSAFNADFLTRREGLSMLVLTSDDAHADNEAWAARGLSCFEPVHFARQARMPDGSTATVAFTIAFAIDPTMPEAAFFICQQHNPEAFWKPDYQVHANGARKITAVTMRAEAPLAHRSFFEKMVAPEAVRPRGDGLEIALDGGRIEVLTKSALQERFATSTSSITAEGSAFVATSIAVENLDALADKLREADVSFTPRGEAIEIAPDLAGGVLLEFLPA